jgi:hypothetical protein
VHVVQTSAPGKRRRMIAIESDTERCLAKRSFSS